MTAKFLKKIQSLEILKVYYVAVVIYIIPLFFLFFFVVDQLSIQQTDMILWVVFLISLTPCGFFGTILMLLGAIISFKHNKSKLNKIIGLAGTFAGFIVVLGGILGFMLIYIVTS